MKLIDELVHLDYLLSKTLFIPKNEYLTPYFTFATSAGNLITITIGVIALTIFFILDKKYQYLKVLVTSVSAGLFMTFIMKNFFQRERPESTINIVQESTFSFPSGHAILAVTFYGTLTYFVMIHIKNKLHRRLTFIFGSLIVLSIAFSRIYLEVHYLSDIIAGLIIGVSCTLLGIYTNKKAAK